jgi:hypothetical protein
MASISFPAALEAQILNEGYGETPQTATIRTQMDAGPAKARRRFSARVDNLQLNFLLSDTDLDTLLTFYTTTSKEGSLRFNMTHPRTGATDEFRFIDAPGYNRAGNHYRVSVPVEKMP